MASFILPLISGLAGGLGGLTQQTNHGSYNGTQTQSQSGTQTQSTSPNINPLQQMLAQLFSKGSANLYNQSTNLNPYTQQGLEQIGATGSNNANAMANAMASRGLSYSPAAATAMNMNRINTGNQQNQFMSQIPLLQRQLQGNALTQMMQAYQTQPYGVTGTGSSNMTGTTTSSGTQTGNISGNPWAGGIAGLGAGLAAPSSPGGPTNLANIFSNLGYGPSYNNNTNPSAGLDNNNLGYI